MKITKRIITAIVLIIMVPVLFVNLVILINSYTKPDEVPSFFGWKPFIVLSGSMETDICAGDIVVVKEVDTSKLKENDIIAFREENIVITHRIVKIENVNGVKHYITKGDNNNSQDKGYVVDSQVEGIYKFKIARVGNLAMFIQTPIGIIVCLSIPIIILLFLQSIDSKNDEKYYKEKERKERKLEKELEELKQENKRLQRK